MKVCKIPKSTWYYRKKEKASQAPSKARGRPIPEYSLDVDGNPVMDRTIEMHLKAFRAKLEFSNGGGCKIIPHYLRRDNGIIVNHKKIYRLCKKNNLLLPRNKKKLKKNIKVCVNRVIHAPNKLWQFDIKYGYIHGENRHFYLLAFIDTFSKDVIAYHIGKTCKAKDLSVTFEEAIRLSGIKDLSQLVIRSDRGPQMTSNQFREYINGMVEHEFIPPKNPNKNAYIESFFSLFEIEFLQVRYFVNFADAYKQTVDYIEHYNNRRLHQSIFKLPPKEFKEKFNSGFFKDEIIEIRA